MASLLHDTSALTNAPVETNASVGTTAPVTTSYHVDLNVPAASPPLPLYRRFAFWAFVAVAVGVTWRTTRLLLQFPIWGDESFVCVNFLDKSYLDILGPLRVGQICPLTFLWTELAMYHLFGPSELVMRFIPYLLGIGALFLFWPMCRRVLPETPAALALALLAVSYYPMRHAVEVKPYAQDLFIALTLYLPAALYVLEPHKLSRLVFLTCFVPVALVSSYPAVLVAGSISIVLLPIVRRQGANAKGWFVAYNVLLLATFVANYLLIGKPQVSIHESNPDNAFNSTWQEWFPALDPISLVWWFLKANTGNMVAYPFGGPNFGSSLTTLLCLVGGWTWWRSGNRQLLGLLLWPFVLSIVAGVLHKYPYGGSARLDQHLAPAICLLMANGIVTLIHRFALTPGRRRQAIVLVGVFLAGFGVLGILHDVFHPYKTSAERWNRTLVNDLMARVGPNDRVVLFNHPLEVRPGLEWYFRQHDDRVSWNGQVDWRSFEQSGGKLWCVQIFAKKPALDPIKSAMASHSDVRQLDCYTSIGPPEHGDDPDLAEVYCFERKQVPQLTHMSWVSQLHERRALPVARCRKNAIPLRTT